MNVMNKLNSLDILFEEEPHRYSLRSNPLIEFHSCTEFLKQFFEPFDAVKIATNLVNNYPKYRNHTVESLTAEWKGAADAGTRTHEDMENHIRHGASALTAKGREGIAWFEKYRSGKRDHTFIPEQIIYSQKLRLAGMVDLLAHNPDDNSYSIIDWKTSKRIDTSAFRGKKGLHPASHDLEDCNYIHYTLQMTLYRYILEEHYGLTVTSQKILHLHDNGATVYDCHYMKDHLLKILGSQ
jgi:ATP-dependent exoDNAse (exonuclease V) beta subunit